MSRRKRGVLRFAVMPCGANRINQRRASGAVANRASKGTTARSVKGQAGALTFARSGSGTTSNNLLLRSPSDRLITCFRQGTGASAEPGAQLKANE